jgi:hypothetical protein
MLNSALVFARVVSLYPFPYYFVSDRGEGLDFLTKPIVELHQSAQNKCAVSNFLGYIYLWK